MPTYLSPGVYVEEVDRGTKPIEAVGTAVAAFVGYTERAADTQDGQTVSLLGKPTLVTNWSQFVQKFGEFVPNAYLPDAVYGYFANGGGRCYVVSIKTFGAAVDESMASPAKATIPSAEEKPAGLLEFTAKEAGPSGNAVRVEVKPGGEAEAPTFTLTVSMAGRPPETFEGLTFAKGDRNVATVVNTQSRLVTVQVLGRPAANVVPAAGAYALVGGEIKTRAITVQDYQGSVVERKGIGGLEPLDDVTMVCAPDLMASYVAGEMDLTAVQGVQQSIIDYCDRIKYCFAILDAPPAMSPEQIKQWRLQVNYDSTRAALYYPWIEVADQSGQNGRTKRIPPCGHVAGVYARSDGERGVHKAPANEVVRGALGLEVQLTKGEQDGLNPIGINCLRAFPGRGIRVWGARTLSSDPSWRYINVRRLFNMVEESIERGTQWVVFEPNDPNLWARVTRDVTAFLRLVWRSGALFGATPEQAFYVKCDAETNPPEVRDLGQLIIEVGMAPVKPAEFVIFRVSQWAGPNASE